MHVMLTRNHGLHADTLCAGGGPSSAELRPPLVLAPDATALAVREEVEAAEKEADRLQHQGLFVPIGPKKSGRQKKTEELTEVEGAARQPVSKRSRVRNYHQMQCGSDEDGDGADDSSEYVCSEEEDEEPYAKNKVGFLVCFNVPKLCSL
eukprot:298299-Pelagomonas_calceolata.AAC.1